MSGFRTILFERQGPVASITLDRPEVLNAYNTEMRDDLYAALRRFDDDPSVRAVVLRGARSRVLHRRRHARVRIGAVAGRRARGALAARRLGAAPLAAAADDRGGSRPRRRRRHGDGAALRRPHRRARRALSLPETGLGMIPGVVGTQTAAARVGVGRALDLVLTGAAIDARRALAV